MAHKQDNEQKEPSGRNKRIQVVSTSLIDGTLVETLYLPAESRTLFCIGSGTECREQKSITIGEQVYVPFSASNNLIRHGVLLLPSKPEAYGSDRELLDDISNFIHRYVDVSPSFQQLASYYVLLSWIYDSFNELPYLRFRGDYGSGKTRALLVIGSICYKPIFAGGASTVSPLFRMLDSIRGTLIVDEADFRVSDEKAEVVKILNNGNARGFPVLRSEVTSSGSYSPQAFSVYGPKLVATRSDFQDQALESRCLTEQLGRRRLRDEIPLSLPDSFEAEALSLRNRLLSYRFNNAGQRRPVDDKMDKRIEPRLRQVFAPLLSLVDDDVARGELVRIAQRYHDGHVALRSTDTEIRVLEAISDVRKTTSRYVSIADVRTAFLNRYGSEYEHAITHRWIGSVVRRHLHLNTTKRRGVFVIPQDEFRAIDYLLERYGVEDDDVDA